jgi:hypothetical protein
VSKRKREQSHYSREAQDRYQQLWQEAQAEVDRLQQNNHALRREIVRLVDMIKKLEGNAARGGGAG